MIEEDQKFVGCEHNRHEVCSHKFTYKGASYTCHCDCHKPKEGPTT